MKKRSAVIMSTCLVMTLFTGYALADVSDAAETDPKALMPLDTVQFDDKLEIRKVYELDPAADPAALPRDSFERGGYRYECTDILREVIIGDTSKNFIETMSIESQKNDMSTVLSRLPQSKEIITEGGFTGVLDLDTATIKVEAAEHGTTSKPYTITRSYPNLSSADTQYLPKSIEDSGKILTLQDVQWQTDNRMNVDDYEIGNRFTAIATYGGTKTISYVKGYTITANYEGEIFKSVVSAIRYTVIFSAVPVASTFTSGLGRLIIVILLTLVALATGTALGYLYIKKRREKNHYEKNTAQDYPDTDYDNGSGDSGIGDGEY